MRRFVVVLLICVAVVGTAVAGFSFAGVRAPQAPRDVTTVTVHMTEYHFDLSLTTVPTGTVIFNLINDGKVPHNFSIAGMTSDNLAPAATATMTVDFPAAGDFSYLCTLPGHAEAGMQGTLTVTGTTPAPKPTATILVTEKEFKITLRTTSGKLVKSVRHRLIRFKVKNVGVIGHNFVIAGKQTLVLTHGKSQSINVKLTKGKHKYLCSIKGHAAAGMKGVLLVT